MAGQRGRPEASEVADPLLDVLRRELAGPDVAWAEPPELLADGVTARAFSLRLAGAPSRASGPLVCRVFCDGGEALPNDQVAVEAALHNALRDAGFPAPGVLAWGNADAPLGWPFLVMERAPGRNAFDMSMLGLAIAAGAEWLGATGAFPLALATVWISMAGLLRRLHRVPGRDVAQALAKHGVAPERLGLGAALGALEGEVAEHGPPGADAALEWLRAHAPVASDSDVLAHGDFWYGNVMVSPRRVTLLDWTQAGLGPRELDLGWMSNQHYSRLPLVVPDPLYDWLWLPVRPFTWLLMAPIRYAYVLGGGVDLARVRYFGALCALRSLVMREKLLRECGGADRPAELRAWGSPHTVALLRRKLRRITGVWVTPS